MGCLVKDTLKVGSSLRGDGWMRLRMKKPAPQQKSTPIISSTLTGDRSELQTGLTDRRADMSHSPEVPESVDGQSSDAAAGPTAVLVGAAAASRPTLASANSS